MLQTIGFFLVLNSTLAGSQEPMVISLPTPQKDGGKTLMKTLEGRRTTREFSNESLPPQVLANLLWAAFGINRPESGQRTAPSAMNSQEIDLYLALSNGLFRYNPKENQLERILEQDLRPRAGGNDSFREAPLTLIFVADLPRLAKAKPETRPFYAAFDAGCICQNVYLYCASEGLGTVVHDLDRTALASAMKLGPEQQVILAQAIGFPKAKPAASAR